MAFQFSLAAVLRIRLIVEAREERVLQGILHEMSQTRHALEQIDASISRSNSSRRAELFKHRIGGHHHLSDGEVQGFQQSDKESRARLAKLQLLCDQQLKIYEAARRDREMLTDMRDEKRSVHDSEQAKREQKTLDDNYIARRGRI